jgi:hypothetical protein
MAERRRRPTGALDARGRDLTARWAGNDWASKRPGPRPVERRRRTRRPRPPRPLPLRTTTTAPQPRSWRHSRAPSGPRNPLALRPLDRRRAAPDPCRGHGRTRSRVRSQGARAPLRPRRRVTADARRDRCRSRPHPRARAPGRIARVARAAHRGARPRAVSPPGVGPVSRPTRGRSQVRPLALASSGALGYPRIP